MNALLATLSRELRAYFFSPLAYVVLSFFLLINGVIFAIIVYYISDPLAGGQIAPLKMLFGDTFFFWLILLFVTPILTMRLIAEERKSGTVELLLTAPVTEGQVVLGKYLAALFFYAFLWLPTLAYVAIVARSGEVDFGPVLSSYLGVLLIGGLFLAIGVFGSSVAENQIVAAIVTFALLLLFFVVAFLDVLFTGDTAQQVLSHMNLLEHMDEFGRGIVDTRRLVYYVTTIAFFLFLSSRMLESKKWS